MTFDVNATDPDANDLTYYCNTMPPDATFESPTFTWRPDYSSSGIYELFVQVTDGELWDSETVTVTVTNAPRCFIGAQ